MDLTTLGLAASGLRAQQARIDLVGHNLANLQSPGFRASRPELVDLPADPSTFGLLSPVRLTSADDPARGVAVIAVTQPDLPGPVISTDAPLDVALPDGIYLAVRGPDGQTAYTRDGHVEINAQGELQIEGRTLIDSPRLTPGTGSPSLDGQGNVVVDDATGRRVIGRLPLVRFSNPEGLEPLGFGLLRSTPASGAPQPLTTSVPDALRTGALEGSNVDLARELTSLLRAQRAYQAGTQLIRTWDELAGETVREIGHS
jgi:flagellar basal-body rod protein FlgG